MLPPSEIAFRCAGLWLVGVVAVVTMSGYLARPSRNGPASLWAGLAAIIATICWVVACFGFGMLTVWLAPERGQLVRFILYPLGALGALWLTSILIQVGQNLAYRMVGAPVQRIRWYNGNETQSRSRK